MSFGYSRTVLRRPGQPANENGGAAVAIGQERFEIERAYSALMQARLRIMKAERARPGCTDPEAITHVLLAMDLLKPGAIAKLMPLAEDER